MLNEEDFAGRVHIEIATLHVWLEEGWLLPLTVEQKPLFRDVDIARARLIQDLSELMGVNDEGIHVVLGLVDQLHAVRRDFDDLVSQIKSQSLDLPGGGLR